jgi:hypothetical protein
VMGNHEFYGGDYDSVMRRAREACARSNVVLLENEAVDIAGVRFLGATLWTDFDCLGETEREHAMDVVECSLADYRAIRHRGGYLAPAFTRHLCLQSQQFIRREVRASPLPVVVATHHAPTLDTQNPRYELTHVTAGFHSNRPELLADPVRLWIHGHHHWCDDQVRVNGIPIVSNQRGYPREPVNGFDWCRTIAI